MTAPENIYAVRTAASWGPVAYARKAAARGLTIGGTTSASPVYALPFKPYVYRGTGQDVLTAFMDDEPEEGERLTRRRERMEMLAGLRLWTSSATEPPAGYVTAPQAAEMLGVTRRTIERYKSILGLTGRTP